jgi:hypothetical protein
MLAGASFITMYEVSGMKHRVLGIVLITVLLLTGAGATPALAADAVVGTGTPASCDEAAFDLALATVQSAPPGVITFDCGPADHTIDIYTSATITTDVTIDGGGKIRLFAQGVSPTFTRQRFFEVSGGGSLTLRSITLEGARGPAGDGWGSQGGSIVVWGASYLDVQDTVITNSASSAWGGAIANEGGAVRVQDSQISGSAKWGGAYNGANGYDIFINATVVGSTATEGGGGLRFWNTLGSNITESTITGNSAGGAGGGIENLGGVVTVTGSYVENNSAVLDGGGIHSAMNGSTAGALQIGSSRIAGNQSDANGGGLYGTGAVTLVSTTVNQNSANQGGGLANGGGQLSLDTVVLSMNTAGAGGGLYVNGGGTTVAGSLISENTATTDGGGLFLVEVLGADSSNWVMMTGSDIVGNAAGQAGGGIAANRAYVTLTDVAIHDNDGTGLYVWPSLGGGSYVSLSRSSIYDNRGVGVYVGSQSTLLAGNSTISQNDDWGVWSGLDSNYTSLIFSTVRGNRAGQIRRTGGRLNLESAAIDRGVVTADDCYTEAGLPAVEGSGSWASDASCGLGVTASSDLDLGPLALNGGRTLNHLPQPDSVLIDRVPCGVFSVDQRGIARPQGATCDVGAVEVGASPTIYRAFVPNILR